jgi:hypothetical protein
MAGYRMRFNYVVAEGLRLSATPELAIQIQD